VKRIGWFLLKALFADVRLDRTTEKPAAAYTTGGIRRSQLPKTRFTYDLFLFPIKQCCAQFTKSWKNY
jgi:hypothetical protein